MAAYEQPICISPAVSAIETEFLPARNTSIAITLLIARQRFRSFKLQLLAHWEKYKADFLVIW